MVLISLMDSPQTGMFGEVTGCTISVFLFAAAMYMVVKRAEKESLLRKPRFAKGHYRDGFSYSNFTK